MSLRSPEGPRLASSQERRQQIRRWIGVGIAAVGAVIVLSNLPSCEGERPSISQIKPVQPQPEEKSSYEKDLAKGGWSLDDPGRLAGSTAHKSLSDLTYPENPTKKVTLDISCAVLPSANRSKSWVIQNPLTSVEKGIDLKHQLAVFAGVIPLASRYSDGALHFETVQAVAIDGVMELGQLGEMPHGGVDVSSVQLERTDIRRDPAEMPPELFGDYVVYLNDVDGNRPPVENRIPAHVIYADNSTVGKYCLLEHVSTDQLLLA